LLLLVVAVAGESTAVAEVLVVTGLTQAPLVVVRLLRRVYLCLLLFTVLLLGQAGRRGHLGRILVFLQSRRLRGEGVEAGLVQRQAQLAALVVVALTGMALQCRGLRAKVLEAPET